jgi:hypothetical protein
MGVSEHNERRGRCYVRGFALLSFLQKAVSRFSGK